MAAYQITPWPSEALWRAMEPLLPGFAVETLASIDSTNAELMRRVRAGHSAAMLLIAERQTAGRGRLGRVWHGGEPARTADAGACDPAGPDCLMFSLGLPLAPPDWSGLSLVVGCSLAESLHPGIALKWPNDLWWQSRKLAGILVETANLPQLSTAAQSPASRYVVIGVGLNIRCPELPDATQAAGLQEVLPGITAALALQRVLPNLVGTLLAFERLGFAPFQAGFNARDALAGLPVSLSDGQQGLAQGVDDRGALRLLTADGWRGVTGSEVSVRPQSQQAMARTEGA